MTGSLVEGAKLLGLACALAALAMAHPATMRVIVALVKFSKRYAPRWLVPAVVACAFIPGPLDELFVLAVVLYPVLRSPRKRKVLTRYVRVAWHGQLA